MTTVSVEREECGECGRTEGEGHAATCRAHRLNSPAHLDFVVATQVFLDAYRAGATIEGCERAMEMAGFRIVRIHPSKKTEAPGE